MKRTAFTLAVIVAASVIGGVLLAHSQQNRDLADVQAGWESAAAQYTAETPPSGQGLAEMVSATGRWEDGRTVCQVKLTNLLQHEANVWVDVAAESMDGATKYRSAQALATGLKSMQSEVVTITYFGLGTGPDIPANTLFKCRISGSVTAQVKK